MSTCPSKDLHSVYLDNELPVSYKAEYESHIAACEKCQAQLKRLKSLRALLEADKSDVKFSEKELDESYARLLARMSYSKNVQKSKKPVSKFKSYIGYGIGAVAAVCAFAFVIPVRAALLKPSSSDFQPVARTSMGNLASQVSFDDTLRYSDVSSVFRGDSSQSYMSLAAMKTGMGASRSSTPSSFASYDVFYSEPKTTAVSSEQGYFVSPEEMELVKIFSELVNTNLLFQYNSAYNSDSDFFNR